MYVVRYNLLLIVTLLHYRDLVLQFCLWPAWEITEFAFHLSEPTGQTVPVPMRISLLIKTTSSDPIIVTGMHRRFFFLVKAFFIVKMTSPAIVQLADFWKAPWVWGLAGSGFFSDEEVDICSGYNHPAVVVQPFFFY